MTYQGGHYDPPPLDASSGFTPLDLQGLTDFGTETIYSLESKDYMISVQK